MIIDYEEILFTNEILLQRQKKIDILKYPETN